MRLPDYALGHRVVVCVAVVLLCLWGYLSFLSAPRRETPEFTVRLCVVTTVWPGATVENMEQLVAEPLEQAISSIDEVDQIDTVVTLGQAVIKATVEDGVPPADIANLWDEIRAEVGKVQLPTEEGCRPAVVNSNFGDTAVWLLALYQDAETARTHRYTSRQLEVYADRLRDQIKLLPDVADAELHGEQQEVIYLETDARTWSKLDLTTRDLASRLADRNIVSGGGTIESPVGRVSLKPSGNYSAVDQINRLVTSYDGAGNPIHLEDLGIRARRGYADPPRDLVRFSDGDGSETLRAESVVLAVTMKSGRNVVKLGEQLTAAVERAHQTMLPADVRTSLVVDTPTKVRTTISEFIVNLYQSVGLVLLVALLLIGFRIAMIMAAAIPVVMLGTFALMRLFDVELEQMSIAALIISLGMLVDNAIEVCDNVHRLLHEGVSRRKAALEGARQIGFPILIATLTTIAGFAPMLIALQGAGKEYVFSIPTVVAISLSVSWVLAMTFTTVMAYWFLRSGGGRAPVVWLAATIGKLVRRKGAPPTSGNAYSRLAELAIRFKPVTVVVAIAGFVFALFLLASGRIGTQFFPSAVQEKYMVEVYLPEGATIDQTQRTCAAVEDLVLELADGRVRDILTMVGSGGPRFDLGFDPADPASNYGVLLVHTNDPADVDPMLAEVQRASMARIPGARIRPLKLGMGPPVANPIGVRIVGPGFADYGRMREISERVLDVFHESPRTWDTTQNWGNLGLELAVDVDEALATPSGVSSASVARSLSAYYSGMHLTTFREGDHQVPVYFRWHPEERTDVEAVALDPIEGAGGKIPLEAVATTELGYAPMKIVRRDINRVIDVSAKPTAGHLANSVLLEDIWPKVEDYARTLPDGYRIEIAGELEESSKAQAQMALSFQITLALLILLLVVQYDSLMKALLILVTIPLATTGAFLGMWIFGLPMGFMEMLGLLALVGIVLNAAIVYIEFAEMMIRERLSKGEGVKGGAKGYAGLPRDAFRAALRRAGELRLLPIALTTLTTAGGLTPLALSGGPLFEGMATSLICGLLVGSIMTLFVLPALVALFVEWFGVGFVHEDAPADEAEEAAASAGAH